MNPWHTRDGRRLPLECMTCEHLRNALALILRNGWRTYWLGPILAEIDRRCRAPVAPIRKTTKVAR